MKCLDRMMRYLILIKLCDSSEASYCLQIGNETAQLTDQKNRPIFGDEPERQVWSGPPVCICNAQADPYLGYQSDIPDLPLMNSGQKPSLPV